VIYPFVDLQRFEDEEKPSWLKEGEKYFVAISRLVNWKRFDIVVEACNQLKLNLIIVGEGPDRRNLLRQAGSTVKLPGYLPDRQVAYLLRHAQALIHPQKEDFGMTVIEANACGVPVIAFRAGGALETVIEGSTGCFFNQQTSSALVDVLRGWDSGRFDRSTLREHAQQFTRPRFIERWQDLIEGLTKNGD